MRIIEISGVCSFSKGKADLVVSIISTAAKAIAPAWKSAVGTVRKQLDKHLEADKDDGGGKRRDGYGQEVGGGGNIAEKEGGIIVCLPRAGGMYYSNEKLRRKPGSRPNGVVFPTRSNTATPLTVDSAGVLRIAAFDSKYNDNAGSYEIKFSISREGGE